MRNSIKETATLLRNANHSFTALVKGGLTKEELEACIHYEPEVWARFAKYLDTLPTEAKAFHDLSTYTRRRLEILWEVCDVKNKKDLKEYLESHQGRYRRIRGLGDKTRLDLLALSRSSKDIRIFPNSKNPIIFK